MQLQEKTQQNPPIQNNYPSDPDAQILHLKRLLVTLKEQYERGIASIQDKLITEQKHNESLQLELTRNQTQLQGLNQLHFDELKALGEQQNALRSMLEKNELELSLLREQNSQTDPHQDVHKQRLEQLERVIPYLRERTEEANLETEQLRNDLDKTLQQSKILQEQLCIERENSQKEIDHLTQTLSLRAIPAPSTHLHQDLQPYDPSALMIFEHRLSELLNEKNGLEIHLKQLKQQFEHQSANLSSFQEKIQEQEHLKCVLESCINEKTLQLSLRDQDISDLKEQCGVLAASSIDKMIIQEKYEQLKEEQIDLSHKYEEILDVRIAIENQLNEQEILLKQYEHAFIEKDHDYAHLYNEKELLESHSHQLKTELEDSEARLKVSQQHLAKKVKEATMLQEKTEAQQFQLDECSQQIESLSLQISYLQSNLENTHKEEKRLQEQLHDALKSTESQVTKWEEKYFKMYDKWQESENQIRELKKFEERHVQMQNFIANLGSFMGSATPVSHHSTNPISENYPVHPSQFPFTESQTIQPLPPSSEEKYDIFGMRLPPRSP